ncbi:WecB/TagA/CpsF family glycosyltransferase [Leptolyngbya sp. FACHB-261]|uniref:WecB/TagA/CpsF family glycosyltransferase n=1 Tax=Leptolyngbya sp. FACHB-261 TaxID=2692806 RepID=UPI00168316C8|nr:WecB/TagA/CpsF family glycosyltransferase [Leptolyngbya sp. FACHB-261]MBD2103248.1 WecB/TagA/CpsF family glycosyltransferase [Leptolyngbya sp. FACHB-261]
MSFSMLEEKARNQQLFGMSFYNGDLQTAVAEMLSWVRQGDHLRVVVTPNVDHIVNLRNQSSKFNQDYAGAYWRLPDGMPVVWASALLGYPLRSRIPGSDLLPQLLAGASERQFNVAVIGASSELLNQFKAYCRKHHPGINLVSLWAAPKMFDVQSSVAAAHAQSLHQLPIDILLVGLGFPKQETWIFKYGSQTSAKLAVGIGASIEFLVGTKPRAPAWMRERGLEWLHRMMQEPQRLAPRYLHDFYFFKLLLDEWQRTKISGRKHG